MNMRSFFYMLVILALASSCNYKTISGNGIVTEQVRDVKDFNSINVGGTFNVYLKKSNVFGLTIVADSNLMSVIKSEVTDSVLNIESLKTIINSEELKLIVSSPDLKSINFSGAADIQGDTGLVYEALTLNISGAGKIDLNMHTRFLKASVSGGANIILSGTTNILDLSISGAGKIEAEKFVSKTCNIELSGLGEAQLNVSEKLDVIISGLGKVEYTGSPVVNQSISGGGKVVKKQ
jgi:hypothetical protein